MLREIIEATGLTPEFCASVLSVPISKFREWLDAKQPLPHFIVPELCSILGVSEKLLTGRRSASDTGGRESLAPAIWFKLRNERLVAADREFIGLVRRLGFFAGQLESIRGGSPASAWQVAAQSALKNVDRTAPPAIQGREAALRFRAAANLEHAQTGIGDLLRPRLRQSGLLLIETPIPKSALEGCCFHVGKEATLLPCVFANTFKSTWFRRNEVLLHEVCHAIFDLENDAVSLDFKEQSPDTSALPEVRARAFAREVLVPRSVLVHYANQFGYKWHELTPQALANLIAAVHAEQQTLVSAAYENGFVSAELAYQYGQYDCAPILRSLSSHALNTAEFLRQQAELSPKWIAPNRGTTVGPRSIRLPAGYVQKVVETLNQGDISFGKAAEMLMMDRQTFTERFGSLLHEEAAA
jgi:Zn-dependent peptidase ImmA (M78 family)